MLPLRTLLGVFSLATLHATCVFATTGPRDTSASGIPFSRSSTVDVMNIGSDGTFDISYFVNITLGGEPFTVILDSGSSDLWVYAPDANIKVLNNSGLTTNVTYGKGSILGSIQFAELQVGEYVVPSQAFIYAQKLGDDFPSGVSGILGISFDSDVESEVVNATHKAWGESNTLGHTVLSNILAQNTSLQPFFDLTLSREYDLASGDTDGAFLIGHHAPDHSAVALAPQVPRVLPNMWNGYIDGVAINGKPFMFAPSVVPGTPAGKLVAVFDSGSTNMVLPRAMVDAIFARIPGSIQVGGLWYAPCYSSVNLTFAIAGQEFPVHPLDITIVSRHTSVAKDGTNTTFTVCQGALQSTPSDGVNRLDMILGDPFLKNVYTSFSFGPENAEGDHNGTSGSFLQFLSLTNAADAWLNFLLTRAAVLSLLFPVTIDPTLLPQLFPADFGAVENTTGPIPSTLPTSTATAPSTTSAAPAGALADLRVDATALGSAPSGSAFDKYGPAVVGLLGANLAVMVLLCVVALAICARGVLRGGARAKAYAPVGFREPKPEARYEPEYEMPVPRYGE